MPTPIWIRSLFAKSDKIRAANYYRRAQRSRAITHALRLESLENRVVPVSGLSVGANVNTSKSTGIEAETTIAINPTNGLNLFDDDTAVNVGRYSTNGGTTWLTSSGLPTSDGDVQAAWDKFGNLFVTEFGGNTDTALVLLSTNGGMSFTSLGSISGSAGCDQPSIAVGPGGTTAAGSVWVTYADPSGTISAAGAAVTGLGAVGTFSAPEVAPGSTNGDFGSVTIGPSGQVMVSYQRNDTGSGPGTIEVNEDADGLGSGGFGAQVAATSTNVGGFSPITPQPNRTIDAEGNLVYDDSGGAHNGRVYLVYVNRPSTSSNDTDIYTRYSDNNGTTWSAALRVNDDTSGNGKAQFMPAIAVDQTTGNLAVTWLDCRNSTGNNTSQVFGALSTDGGNSFMTNAQISTGTNNATVNVIANTDFDYGDYDTMSFNAGVFYRSWADNSNSTGDNPAGAGKAFDLYTAKVTVVPPVAPSSVYLDTTGNMIVTDDLGTQNDTLTLIRSGTNYQVTDPNNPLTAGTGAVQVNANTVDVAIASITGTVQVGTLAGNDSLVIDFSGGAFTKAITYDGGAGTDKLSVHGTGTETVTDAPSATTAGSGHITVNGVAIDYSNLEGTDFDNLGTFTQTPAGASDVVTLANGFNSDVTSAGEAAGTVPAAVFSGTTGGVAFPATSVFRTANVILDTTAVDGSDTITVTSANNASGMTNLTINTGTGADTVNLNGLIKVAGNVTISTQTATDATGVLAIEAANLAITGATGVGSSAKPIETQVPTLEALGTTGGIFIANTGDLVIGTATVPLSGVHETGASGDIVLTDTGSITVATSGENIQGKANVTVTATGATSNIQTGGNQEAIQNLGTGTVTLNAGQDVLLGQAANYGDVNANQFGDGTNASVVINAGRDLIIQGTGPSSLDSHGGSVTATAGHNVTLAAGGAKVYTTGGGGIALTAGSGGTFTDNTGNTIASSNGGPVTISADTMVLGGPISAVGGTATLRPSGTTARDVTVGTNPGGTLGLTIADLNQVTATTLVVGRTDNPGMLTVTANIDPANAQNISLLAGGDITVNAGTTLQATTNVVLEAGHDVTLPVGSTVQAGGTIAVSIDFGNPDPGVGHTATLSGTIVATSMSVTGVADPAAGDALIDNSTTINDNYTFSLLSSTGLAQITDPGSIPLNLNLVEDVTLNNQPGSNFLTVVDNSNTSYGTQSNPEQGFVVAPTGAESGQVTVNGGSSFAQALFFNNISGSNGLDGLVINGDGDSSSDTDQITVLAPSDTGLASSFNEPTFASGVDSITVSDSRVSIVNATAGQLLPVNLVTSTFAGANHGLLVRGGNEAGPTGDLFTVTPSANINMLMDGMNPTTGSPGDRLDFNAAGIARVYTDPSVGSPAVRFEDGSNGATVGFTNIESTSVTSAIGRLDILGDRGQGTVGGGAGVDSNDSVTVVGTGAESGTAMLNGSSTIGFSGIDDLRIDTFDGDDVADITPFAAAGQPWNIAVTADLGNQTGDKLIYHDVSGLIDDTHIVATGAGAGQIDDHGIGSATTDTVVSFVGVEQVTSDANAGDGDALTLDLTPQNDTALISFNPAAGSDDVTLSNNLGALFGVAIDTADTSSLTVNGDDGNDTFDLDLTGSQTLPIPLTVNGVGGADVLTLTGNAGTDSFGNTRGADSASGTASISGTDNAQVSYTGIDGLNYVGNGGADTLTVDGTANADLFTVTEASGAAASSGTVSGEPDYTFSGFGTASTLNLNGISGGDQFTFAQAAAWSIATVNVDGASASNTISIVGTSSDDSFVFDPDTGNTVVTTSGASTTYADANGNLETFNLDGADPTVAPGDMLTVNAPGLSGLANGFVPGRSGTLGSFPLTLNYQNFESFLSVNQPPVNKVPTSIAAVAGTATTIPSLSVSDVDAGSGAILVTLSVLHGTLSGTGFTGNGTSQISFTGTIAAANTALKNVTYTGSKSNGSDTLTMVANDQGNTGFGGPKTDTTTVPIALTPVYFAVGAGNHGGPVVQVYNQDGSQKTAFYAYESTFRGGVIVAVADVNGDGIPDIITGTGVGGGPRVRVFDGLTFKVIADFFAYESTFRGGVQVAAGDLDGGGDSEIITGTGVGGGPRVRAFKLTGGTVTEVANFLAYDSSFRGGVTVAAGDINGDGKAEIITGTGAGGAPDVRAFTAAGTPLVSFFAYDSTSRSGVNVAAGDRNGDGIDEIITGSGDGSLATVNVFNAAGTLQQSFNEFFLDNNVNAPVYSGVRVAAVDLDGDNKADIVAGSGPSVRSQVTFLQTNPTNNQLYMFNPFEASFTGGVYVG